MDLTLCPVSQGLRAQACAAIHNPTTYVCLYTCTSFRYHIFQIISPCELQRRCSLEGDHCEEVNLAVKKSSCNVLVSRCIEHLFTPQVCNSNRVFKTELGVASSEYPTARTCRPSAELSERWQTFSKHASHRPSVCRQQQ